MSPTERPGAGDRLSLFIAAGEASGDAIGARLIRALRVRAGRELRLAGVGGEQMAAEGLVSLFPIRELSVMGLTEVLPALPRLGRRWAETAAAAAAFEPDLVVTIDSSGFSKGLAKRLRRRGVAAPRVHYVAPMVWAWRPGRVRSMAALFDHLLTLFPFETAPFESAGLRSTWVGHPAIEAAPADDPSFRTRHGLSPDAQLLCVLPGSRPQELRRLLPIFGQAAARILAALPDTRMVIPTLPALADHVREAVGRWPGGPIVVEEPTERSRAMAASAAALAASGSVTLELALAGVPMVIAYRVSPLSAALFRRLTSLTWVGLPNIILGEMVVPELLQSDCRPELLAEAVQGLLVDPALRSRQQDAFTRLRDLLTVPGGQTPSERAAEALLALVRDGRRAQIGAHHSSGCADR